MTDNSKFGGGRGAQFGDRISPGSANESHCAQCEAMLADALDGTLSAADQAIFDAHMAICGLCSDMLADARRGAAWLEMLRDPRPEPPAALLERILAQTAGAQTAGAQLSGAQTAGAQLSGAALNHSPFAVPAAASGFVTTPAAARPFFRPGLLQTVRHSFSMHGLLQPRLAMTAAMAFFSIALTLNVTGVRLSELRPGDLRPSSISLGFHSAQARVARYYEGLRVVYVLESRVHELQSDSDSGGSTDSSSPASTPASQGTESPASTPDGGAPEPSTPRTKAPGPGSSRRESLIPSARLVAVNDVFLSRRQTIDQSSIAPIASAENDPIDARKVRALA